MLSVPSALNFPLKLKRDLHLRTPDEAPYDTFKAELMKHTAASEQCKLQELISGEELGDRQPTQLLCRMQQLLGDKLLSSWTVFTKVASTRPYGTHISWNLLGLEQAGRHGRQSHGSGNTYSHFHLHPANKLWSYSIAWRRCLLGWPDHWPIIHPNHDTEAPLTPVDNGVLLKNSATWRHPLLLPC